MLDECESESESERASERVKEVIDHEQVTEGR
jgi:hypothetical protein